MENNNVKNNNVTTVSQKSFKGTKMSPKTKKTVIIAGAALLLAAVAAVGWKVYKKRNCNQQEVDTTEATTDAQ